MMGLCRGWQNAVRRYVARMYDMRAKSRRAAPSQHHGFGVRVVESRFAASPVSLSFVSTNSVSPILVSPTSD
jgi:hypothetical protein